MVDGKIKISNLLERFVPFVAPEVDFVIGGIDKVLVANVAAMAASFRVHFEVKTEVGAVGKGFVAILAGVTFRRSLALAPVGFQIAFFETDRVTKFAFQDGLLTFRPGLVRMIFFRVLRKTFVAFKHLIALVAEEIVAGTTFRKVFRIERPGAFRRGFR